MISPPYAVVVLGVEVEPVVYVVAETTLEESRLGVWLDELDDSAVLDALALLREALRARRAGFVPADLAPRRWAA